MGWNHQLVLESNMDKQMHPKKEDGQLENLLYH